MRGPILSAALIIAICIPLVGAQAGASAGQSGPANRSAPVLIAFGKDAREKGHYNEALTFFQAALQSRNGMDLFQERFNQALDRLDDQWEAYYSSFFQLKKGRLEAGRGLRRIQDGLFGFVVVLEDVDTVSGTRKARLLFDFAGEKIPDPAKPDAKPQSLARKDIQGLFDRLMKDLVAELGREFPDNPLRVTKQGESYLIEGVMNADYPHFVGQAYYEIALTYKMQGEFPLSEKYFDLVLARPVLFPFADADIHILYEKIAMYQVSSAEKTMSLLDEIIRRDQQFDYASVRAASREQGSIQVVRAMYQAVKTGGIDKAMDLYRFKDNLARKAHVMKGILEYRNNNLEESLYHLSYAAIQSLDHVVQEIRKKEPLFEYPGVERLLSELENYPELGRYLYAGEAYQGLYYLGLVMERLSDNGKQKAALVFRGLAASRAAGSWSGQAKAKLGS